MFNIVVLKERIKSIENFTESDRKVLSIVDSFWRCSNNYIKANLASRLVKYAGCEAWKIAMDYTYTEHQNPMKGIFKGRWKIKPSALFVIMQRATSKQWRIVIDTQTIKERLNGGNMSNYYEYREVKVMIAHKLMAMEGWEVYGYKEWSK